MYSEKPLIHSPTLLPIPPPPQPAPSAGLHPPRLLGTASSLFPFTRGWSLACCAPGAVLSGWAKAGSGVATALAAVWHYFGWWARCSLPRLVWALPSVAGVTLLSVAGVTAPMVAGVMLPSVAGVTAPISGWGGTAICGWGGTTVGGGHVLALCSITCCGWGWHCPPKAGAAALQPWPRLQPQGWQYLCLEQTGLQPPDYSGALSRFMRVVLGQLSERTVERGSE